MSGTYRAKFDEHEEWRVEIEVENASSMDRAQTLIDLYLGMGEGLYVTDDGDVHITKELVDSECDWDPGADEWEDDEDDDE